MATTRTALAMVTGPDVLATAAVLLPAYTGRYRPTGWDLAETFTGAVSLLHAAGDSGWARQLAQEAAEMLRAYLAGFGEVDAAAPAAQALRGWVTGRRTSTVTWALRAAAEHFRLQLADPTHARDSQGRPCHLSCVEQELAAELTSTKDGRVADERHLPATDTPGGAK